MAGVLSTSRKLPSMNALKKVAMFGAIPQKVPIYRAKNISFVYSDPTPPKDYQLMEESLIPTFHFQRSLPRLPIPDLRRTCERYLRAQRPLLDDDSYLKTQHYVEEFMKKDGIICQQELIKEDKENQHTSYITRPWFDMYLSNRSPLPINFNPFLVFNNPDDGRMNVQLVKASNLVISSLRFYRSLQKEIIEPEVYHLNPEKSNTKFFRQFTRLLPDRISWYGAYVFKAFPLDMSQYMNLFNTTRVPKEGKDQIKHTPGRKHLLVMKGGNFYVFDVIDKDGNIVGPATILTTLEKILKIEDPVAEYPVGILTTENRDVWAAARKHLESIGNEEVLDLIDTSIFNLVLDDSKPGSSHENLIRVFLHADGVNRWFDKSFSLIVTQDGYAGINFEHSWGDGVAVLRYFNDVHVDSTTKPRAPRNIIRDKEVSFRKLDFKLDDKAKDFISSAKQKYQKTCESLEVRVMDYKKFGRKLCKRRNISPDALMQLAFQYAYDQVFERQVATYESCSTAAFKHGRTETVRPCTIETKNFCQAMRRIDRPTREEFQKMIVECSKMHSILIKEAAMGQGFDRHLFALKLKADAMGINPSIFADPAYNAINHNILSTSTLSSDNLMLGAFGPVVPDGFGIGYSMWHNRLGSIITNYAGKTDGAEFADYLEISLNQLHWVLR